MLDVRVWALVLVVQSIPYLAAVLVSLISAAPSLRADLVGPMSAMDGRGATQGERSEPAAKIQPVETDKGG